MGDFFLWLLFAFILWLVCYIARWIPAGWYRWLFRAPRRFNKWVDIWVVRFWLWCRKPKPAGPAIHTPSGTEPGQNTAAAGAKAAPAPNAKPAAPAAPAAASRALPETARREPGLDAEQAAAMAAVAVAASAWAAGRDGDIIGNPATGTAPDVSTQPPVAPDAAQPAPAYPGTGAGAPDMIMDPVFEMVPGNIYGGAPGTNAQAAPGTDPGSVWESGHPAGPHAGASIEDDWAGPDAEQAAGLDDGYDGAWGPDAGGLGGDPF